MATVTGPLHSDTARGQFAQQIIYQRRHGRTVAKRYAAPVEPNTADQLAVQAATKTIAQLWPTLSQADQLSWLPMAIEHGYSPQNAHFVTNWKRYVQGLDPIPTPTEEIIPFDPSTFGTVAAWWDPSEGIVLGSGDYVDTWTDRANSIVLTGNPALFPIAIDAGPPTALSFTADSTSVLLSAAALFTGYAPRTILVAYKRSEVDTYIPIAGQFTTNTGTAFALESWPTPSGGDPHLTAYADDLDSPAQADTAWHASAAVYDGTDATLQRDDVGQEVAAKNYDTESVPFGVGFFEPLSPTAPFLIGDVIVYSEALSPTNLAAALAAVRARYPL